MRRIVGGVVVLGMFLSMPPASISQPVSDQSDLDRFMEQVLTRRDDNWKKLQQFILDEDERVELRGSDGKLVWGETREYTWYLRDGFFVRSPVRYNGVAIGAADREKYEQDFLKRAKGRESRTQEPPAETPAPAGFEGLIKQTREPQFVSSAYFLRFKFEAGRYALVGRETLDNRDLLKIEYYPTVLFSDDPKTRAERRGTQAAGRKDDAAYGDEVQRLMNKVSVVTLWIESDEKQIVKYDFANVGLDFLPMAQLVRFAEMKAGMTMGEPFPGVWLPKRVDATAVVGLASGRFDLTYAIQYSGYREGATSTKYGGAAGK